MASLQLRTGPLGTRLAAHLLRRASYKVNYQRIQDMALMTADQAVDELFTIAPMIHPDGPYYWETGDLFFDPADIVGGAFAQGATTGQIRNALSKWCIYEAMADPSIRWKLMHFMSSFFVVFENPLRHYPYWKLLEYCAFEDLKTLAIKMTLDNNMLLYLNNSANLKNSPNENYAREFLELFTILKGEVQGVGDYTNYTEDDIVQAAKVLTGFRLSNSGYIDPDTGLVRGRDQYTQHDTSDKTFSAAFGGHTIYGALDGQDMYRELEDLVTMIFDQQETARAMVRRLYRFFVNDKISSTVEDDIIEPLSLDLFTNGYDHVAVLKKLLKSVHFYDEDDASTTDNTIGGKIKSPRELYFTTHAMLELDPHYSSDYSLLYRSYVAATVYTQLDDVGQPSRGPDSVEGYPGYNDGPGYSRNWYTPNLLYARATYGLSFKRGKVRNTSTYFPYLADMVQWVENNVDDVPSHGTPLAPQGAADGLLIIEAMLQVFLPETPTGDRYDYFKNALFGDLSPINWYFSWIEYINTGDDGNVRPKIEDLYDAITASLEFQTF